MSETKARSESQPLWPILAIGALLFVILVLLARPCEPLRLRAIFTEPAFGLRNTVCAPMQNMGCRCITSDSGMMLFEDGEPARPIMERSHVTPAVTF